MLDRRVFSYEVVAASRSERTGMIAQTAAQRQAERKARELAAGRVQWKRWVHPDDVPSLTEYADKLARKRARSERAG